MKKEKTGEKAEKKTNSLVEAKVEATPPKAKLIIIKPEDLIPFKDHPYKVIENERMIELTEGVREYGILNPLLVRPLEGEDGRYEIISGHRRFYAAQKLGMRKVPCTVHFIDRIDESGGEVFPSHVQTRRIRQQAENGKITYDEIKAIMASQNLIRRKR